MAQKTDAGHEQARDLTEQALGELAGGKQEAARKHIRQAQRIDPSAPQEVVADLEEDAADRRET